MKLMQNINTKKIFITLLWVLVLSGIATLVAFAIKKKNESTCAGLVIQISPQQPVMMLQSSEIQSVITATHGKEIKGQLIREVDLKKIEDALKKNRWIGAVKMYFDGKGMLIVEVQQKIPQARVIDDAGSSYFLDETANLLPFRPISNLQYPVFTNYSSAGKLTATPAKKILASIKVISNEIMNDAFLMAMVEQIDIDHRGEFVIIPKIGDQVIEFGDSTNCHNKFEKLKMFYKKIIPLNGWHKYNKISLQYKNQIVGTLRDIAEPPVDSLKTLRIINSYAEQSYKQAHDTTRNIPNDVDVSADQSMILQSMERDMPVDENTSIDMRSYNQESILKKRNTSIETKATTIKKQTNVPKKNQNNNDF
jgi:cell division protein FtsQ